MRKIKRKAVKKGKPCFNHPNNFETEECERCHKFFCSECYVEDWNENFYQQFLGKKREFIKRIYCKSCHRRIIRIRIIAAAGVLALFLIPFIIWVILPFL
ncbi:MAG: hypothetical protein ACTSW1_05065 [Candidatus Hodarchaeales archaeon]